MIGNITTGDSFKRLIDYLLKPTKLPEIIGGNYYGESKQEIILSFSEVANQRPSTTKPVKHLIISFAPQDGKIDQRTKYQIAQSALSALGYAENQWLAVDHHRDDPDHYEVHGHDHIHIVVNMITYSGQRVRDGFDKRRFMKILRDLEIKHQLTQVRSPFERHRRRPQKGRYKKFEKAYYRYLKEVKQYVQKPLTTVLPQHPREPEIQELETLIQAASDDRPTMSQFLARMQHLGYRVEQYEGKISKRTGKPRLRFKYHLKSTEKPIYKVKGASRAKLLTRVDYIPERDDLNILKAARDLLIEIPESNEIAKTTVAKYRYGWLNPSKQEKLKEAERITNQLPVKINSKAIKPDLER